YLGVLAPAIRTHPILPPVLTVGVVWVFTLINCLGTRSAGGVQLIATLLKLLPLAAVLAGALLPPAAGAPRTPLPEEADLHPGAITGAAALSLWALLGLESATVPADKVIDAPRTIPRATLFGTAFTGLLYVGVCTAMLLLMPPAALAASSAPF